jgi:SAM-dependent methyltransferase
MTATGEEDAMGIPATAPAAVCPVCGGASTFVEQQPGWGTWHRCSFCDLGFVEPRRLPREPTSLFDAAYRGNESEGGFPDFAHRMRQRKALLADPRLWFWSPAFQETIDFARRRAGRGATVLELGCGLGFLLHALRREGFEAVGMDPAKTVVELNRADGFEVWHGTLDTMPRDWARPDVVVAFFMLHHLEDPLGFVREIQLRWPQAPLVIAQYGPSNQNAYSSMAPRNLTKWNASSLACLLERAGYRADVRNLDSSGSEWPMLDRGRAVLFELLIRVPWLYRVSKRAFDRIVPLVARPFRQESFVLLAFAEPSSLPDAGPAVGP